MAELGVDLGGEGLLEPLDFFGDFAEAGDVAIGITPTVFIGDDG